MFKLRSIAVAACLSCGLAGAAEAAAMVSGGVRGPDTNTLPQLIVVNAAGSSVAITRIQLNGATAMSFPIVWDQAGNPVGPVGNVSFSGLDTPVLTMDFAHFDPGEDFRLVTLDPDPANVPDPDGVSVRVRDLIGVEVLFTFSDNTTTRFVLVDDPVPGEGLILVEAHIAVPEPASLALFGAALAGLALTRGRKRDAA